MNKNFIIAGIVVIVILGLGAVVIKSNSFKKVENHSSSQEISSTNPEGSTVDADGFVRLPGEPSRGEDTYYVTGDVCEQFTVKYMEGLTGKKILRTSEVTPGSEVCQYFISEQNKNMMFQIDVGYYNVADQKKGQEFLGRKVEKNSSIPMDNFVVYQENGLINKIYLILGPDKFVGIDRSAADALTENETIDLAVKLGEKIKNFK